VQSDRFEWDDDKARKNFAKHGVSFELASAAFDDDPEFIEFDDPDPSEERYKRLCRLDTRIYVVNYTERSDRTRIISARLASTREQQDYFDGQP